MGISPEWNVSIVDIHLWKRLWVYCPGHAGVKVNDRVNRLAGKASLTKGLLLGRSEVLRSLKHYLGAQSQGHHTIDRLEERGVERRSARRSSLKGREGAIVSKTNFGTVSKATLGKLLRDGVEGIWAFPRAEIPPWTELNWTELKCPWKAYRLILPMERRLILPTEGRLISFIIASGKLAHTAHGK